MILDIILIAIFLLSVVRGRNKGFLETVLRVIALVGSLVLGTMLTETVSELLYKTSLDEFLIERFTTSAENGLIDLPSYIPSVISDGITTLESMAIRAVVVQFTSTVITTFAFMLVVIVEWAIATAIIKVLRRSRRSRGLIGTVDSSVGLLLGAIRGAIIVLLLLAFIFPATSMFLPDKLESLNAIFASSYLAQYLYNANPLLIFAKSLML